MRQGSVVMLKRGLLGNEAYTLGVCYDSYIIGNRTGLSFIFENGEHDGFSPEEQDKFLFEVDFSMVTSNYQFTNVIKLQEDFHEIKMNALSSPKHLRDESKRIMIETIREEKIDSLI